MMAMNKNKQYRDPKPHHRKRVKNHFQKQRKFTWLFNRKLDCGEKQRSNQEISE